MCWGKPNHPLSLSSVLGKAENLLWGGESGDVALLRVRRSKEDFENYNNLFCFLLLVFQSPPRGNGHGGFWRDTSRAKHSKTVTHGSCHILLHYFPRLAHHVLWKRHTGKGKNRATLGPPSSLSLCARNGCKECWDGVWYFCHFGGANL